jgi:hypothetical protein
MKRSIGLAVSLLTLVATASAEAQAQAPAPTTLTAPAVMPGSLSGSSTLFGVRSLNTVPAGSTVLSWTLTLTAGQTLDLPVTCPAGTVIDDIGLTNPPGIAPSASAEANLGSFLPLYGKNSVTVPFPAITSGQLEYDILCAPAATGKSKLLPPTAKAPVKFPAAGATPGYAKGEQLPKGTRVMVTTVAGAGPNGTVVTLGVKCPGSTSFGAGVATRPGAGGWGGPTVFTLFPSSAISSSTSITAYGLCLPPSVFGV